MPLFRPEGKGRWARLTRGLIKELPKERETATCSPPPPPPSPDAGAKSAVDAFFSTIFEDDDCPDDEKAALVEEAKKKVINQDGENVVEAPFLKRYSLAVFETQRLVGTAGSIGASGRSFETSRTGSAFSQSTEGDSTDVTSNHSYADKRFPQERNQAETTKTPSLKATSPITARRWWFNPYRTGMRERTKSSSADSLCSVTSSKPRSAWRQSRPKDSQTRNVSFRQSPDVYMDGTAKTEDDGDEFDKEHSVRT
jgi:hypothetical protein